MITADRHVMCARTRTTPSLSRPRASA